MPQLLGKGGTEFHAPLAHSFVTDGYAALGQQLFDIAQAEAETMIEPHGIRDDLGRESVAMIVRALRAHGGLLCRIHYQLDSTKTTGVGGERGYDGAKKIKGRKRHLLVDTQGLVLKAKVHAANVMDRDGVSLLLRPKHTTEQFPRVAHLWLDAGYNGHGKGKEWIEKELGWTTQIVRPPPRRVIVAADVEPAPRPASTVLPRRRAVEWFFAWLGQSRRLSKESTDGSVRVVMP